jgi:hypothetical protein
MTFDYPSRPNAGLYTGEAFAPGAQWAPVPCVPDADALMRHLERTAVPPPPPGASCHYIGYSRAGNNRQLNEGVVYRSDLAQACVRTCPK